MSSQQDKHGERGEQGERDEQAREEGAPGRDLTREALALPREIETPVDLWGGIRARIEIKRRRTVVARRSVAGASMLLAAAVVVLAIRSPKQPHLSSRTAPPASEALVAPPGPSLAPNAPAPPVTEDPTTSGFPEEATYLAALATLRPAFDARRRSLPDKDAAAIGASLHAIDAAILVTRGSLLENPEDDDLRSELDAEYEQEIDTMNDVLAWTTRS